MLIYYILSSKTIMVLFNSRSECLGPPLFGVCAVLGEGSWLEHGAGNTKVVDSIPLYWPFALKLDSVILPILNIL